RRDWIEQAVERQGTRHDRALLPVVGGMTNQAEAVNEFLAACPPGEAEAVQRILNGVFRTRGPGQLEVSRTVYNRRPLFTHSEKFAQLAKNARKFRACH